MAYTIYSTALYRRQAKRLAKRYPSLKEELFRLVETLEQNPELGISLGMQAFKVRLAIRSKCKGKSGGARVIYYLITAEREVWLLALYDKSELDSLDVSMIRRLIDDVSTER